MTYKGRYFPTNPKKYRGNPNQIIYRSLWERKVMVYCDKNDAIIEWGSEEVIVPYLSPMDGKIHRYFPDFYMKVRQADGSTKKFIVEVKPKAQTKEPVRNPKIVNDEEQRKAAQEVINKTPQAVIDSINT